MLGAVQLVIFSPKYLLKGSKSHRNINNPLKMTAQHEKFFMAQRPSLTFKGKACNKTV